jgi:hypothetical protein
VSARRWYAAVAAGALALGLGACTGGGDDPPTTSTSSSSSSSNSTTSTSTPSSSATTATGSPTIDPAKLPPEAQKHTPEGAAAFAEYFIEQSNEAWVRPDTTLLPPLSEKGCLSCKSLQETAAELKSKGQRYESDPVTVTEVVPLEGAPGGRQRLRIQLVQHRVDILDRAGKVVSTDPSKKLARTMDLVWEDKSWLVYGIA